MSKLLWKCLYLLLVGLILALTLVACSSATDSSVTSSPAASVSPKTSASAATLYSDNIYLIKNNTTKGNYITDFQGMTLYTYDKDSPWVSNYDDTANLWKLYSSGATAQSSFPINISVITRPDGSKFFAWKGMPLYYYSKDQQSGDLLGDGVNGKWHIVSP
jgi:predicted lipoprotein with Yx(FWY)xxD motif